MRNMQVPVRVPAAATPRRAASAHPTPTGSADLTKRQCGSPVDLPSGQPRAVGLMAAAGMITSSDPQPARDRTSASSGLPLVQVREARGPRSRPYATTMDGRGRLADRTPIRILGWQPGSPLSISVSPAGVLLVRHGGPEALTSRGFLHLRADIRHACRLRTGDRVLLVARPVERMLLIYTPHAVDLMSSAYRAAFPDLDLA